MLNLPAVCNECKNFFPSTPIAEDSTNVTFENKVAGPCPRCGGTGQVPNGVYNFVDNVIELVSGPDSTVTELQRLAEKFKRTNTPIKVKIASSFL